MDVGGDREHLIHDNKYEKYKIFIYPILSTIVFTLTIAAAANINNLYLLVITPAMMLTAIILRKYGFIVNQIVIYSCIMACVIILFTYTCDVKYIPIQNYNINNCSGCYAPFGRKIFNTTTGMNRTWTCGYYKNCTTGCLTIPLGEPYQCPD